VPGVRGTPRPQARPLHLKFYTNDEGRCIARFQPKPEHQGFPGQLHGGIISTLLDVPTQIPLHFIAVVV
jgi:acyl-coenzyme A thioesterase PaaI-like protein